ncbi:hypothetical protein OIDMADRAFT_178901 [Oidiodendron maius Zn]|uniref:Alkylmercury lyase n=1 Tax=Oidiodendron maius (strain Zn) TaxID=913774 RepID=A0A0C3H531_OIDMZ|nr:hypothetical protein OIDMADRAFT_178901 [Oidiodendron maius Zn]
MAQSKPLRIRLLSIPDCPLVESARSVLKNSLAKTHINYIVEDTVGDYGSPTILIDGFDVTGRSSELSNQVSCRFDLPTEEQILAALRGLSVLNCGSLLTRQLQASAFRILLQTARPVPVDHLAAGVDAGITSSIEDLQRCGHIQLDPDGCIVGALGLSLRPTMHGLSIDGSKLWAWCALDVIGIFGFLRASGASHSKDPYSGENILLEFVDGISEDDKHFVFLCDVQSHNAICEDWCPNVNFFTSTQSAEAWREASGVTGSCVSVGNLRPVAVEIWSRLLAAN